MIGDPFLTPFTSDVFQQVNLGPRKQNKLLILDTTGFNNVDVKTAKEHRVYIANSPFYATESVAQYAITLMMILLTRAMISDLNVQKLGKYFMVDPESPIQSRNEEITVYPGTDCQSA